MRFFEKSNRRSPSSSEKRDGTLGDRRRNRSRICEGPRPRHDGAPPEPSTLPSRVGLVIGGKVASLEPKEKGPSRCAASRHPRAFAPHPGMHRSLTTSAFSDEQRRQITSETTLISFTRMLSDGSSGVFEGVTDGVTDDGRRCGPRCPSGGPFRRSSCSRRPQRTSWRCPKRHQRWT